jgi:hypothetical protein
MLIKDDFPTQNIWNKYLSRNPKCSLVIHSKKGFTLDPSLTELKKRAYLIPDPIETAWGSLSIVKAQNVCIRKLLEDPSCSRICTVSGNCIPLRTEDEILSRTIPEESIFTEFNVPDRLKSVKETVSSACKLDDDAFRLHAQWCVLIREHARLLVDHESEYAKCFENVGWGVPDESVYLTMLRQNKQKNIKIIQCIQDGDNDIHGTTFCHWKDMKNYKFKTDKDKEQIPESSPKTYTEISHEELEHLKKGEYLFARKFSDETTVDGKKILEYL